MSTIKIVFAYDGTKYNGSQTQPQNNTVQDKIEEVLKLIGIENKLILSGRTDKNVHASGQVASLKLPAFWEDLNKLKITLTKQLPASIQIKTICKVSNNFHARFSAKRRIYRYIITTKPINAFNNDYIHYEPIINQKIIQEAMKKFIGTYDFEYFSKKGSIPKSTIREIFNIKFYKHKEFYIFKFEANSYLRSQIRMMVSFLLKISQGKLTIDDLKNQLQKKELVSWTLAPSNGLYLSKVIY